MTYPWTKQGHRPACGFWSVSGQALKKRTVRRSSTRSQSTRVFILTEAIYSISAILFVLLFFKVFCRLQPADQTERNSVTAFELEYNDPFVSHTLCQPGTNSSQGNVTSAQVSKYLCRLMLIDDGCDMQDGK